MSFWKVIFDPCSFYFIIKKEITPIVDDLVSVITQSDPIIC